MNTQLENIIKSDPTLNYFVNVAEIDWLNDWHIKLRFAALQIAISKYIDKKY